MEPLQHTPSARKFDPRLVGLNAVLLGALVTVVLGAWPVGSSGGAPPTQPPHTRGEYTLISGRVLGGASTHAVYILDAANHELVALTWDRGKSRLEPLGYRNFADDAVLFQGGR